MTKVKGVTSAPPAQATTSMGTVTLASVEAASRTPVQTGKMTSPPVGTKGAAIGS